MNTTMDLVNQYNSKSPAVKRLMREACELKEPTEDYSAAPINDNLFEWHFTIRGAADTEFEGGLYHGRILFPSEYPMKPPNILLLTPNGRFETNKKICLSISGHHPETWQPSWCVRTALLALIAFMPTPGNGTVGSLDYTKEERQMLARKSRSWECNECGQISNCVLPCDKPNESSSCENFDITKDEEPKATATSNDDSKVGNISSSYSQEVIDKLLTETNKLLSKSDVEHREDNTDNGDEEQFENLNLPDEPICESNLLSSQTSGSLLANVSSNVSNSKVTVSVIVALIAFLLYRRIFLLN